MNEINISILLGLIVNNDFFEKVGYDVGAVNVVVDDDMIEINKFYLYEYLRSSFRSDDCQKAGSQL